MSRPTPSRPWPWRQNYAYARPDGHPYRLEDILAAFEPGWYGLVAEAFAEADRLEMAITQVKQKFGHLTIYGFGGSSYPSWQCLATDLAARSATICEVCGSTRSVATAGSSLHRLLRTLCVVCRGERRRGERRDLGAMVRWSTARRAARLVGRPGPGSLQLPTRDLPRACLPLDADGHVLPWYDPEISRADQARLFAVHLDRLAAAPGAEGVR